LPERRFWRATEELPGVVSWFCVLALTFVLARAGPAAALGFDLRGGGDFGATGANEVSLSATKAGLTLELMALSLIAEGGLPLTTGAPGTVFIDRSGAGVRTASPSGSKSISGDGGHRDEALTLTFATPVVSASVVLTLTELDPGTVGTTGPGKGKGSGKAKKSKKTNGNGKKKGHGGSGDLALLYVDATSAPALDPGVLLANLVPVAGESDTFTLALAGLVLTDSLSSISVRAANGHFLVGSIDASPVPEPATSLLVGCGLALLAALRRSRRS
jgi:hypothetical protein